MKLRQFETIEGVYSFKADDDWGDYYKGKYRKGTKANGYNIHWYNCTDGERHRQLEHIMKWEYFNGEIPDGLEIDHIIPIKNGGTNKLSNLRLVTHQENMNNPNSLINKSNSHKGQIAWNKGNPWDEKTKKKISESKEKYKKSVVQLKDYVVVDIFDSIREAERKTNISHSNIQHCCNGGFFYKGKWVSIEQAGGFKWMHKSDYEEMLAEQAN